MIHIVFNESEIALMKQVIELDETLAGDVWMIRDDFAVGPLAGIDTPEGWEARLESWKKHFEGSPYSVDTVGSFDDRSTVAAMKTRLDENSDEQVWIWMAQNQHDVCGYYWLMSQLKDYQGRIMIVFLNNLPFINEKGQLFYPSWLHEVMPKELLKAKKVVREIFGSEFEVDPDEWKKLMEENAPVRILEGGKKIAGKEANFYDSEILRNITGEWQKASRVLSNTLNRMKIKTGDLFLASRIKELIQQGKVEVMGDMNKSWKDFDVKIGGSSKAESNTTAEATA